MRQEIARARGNEVCFLAQVGEDGEVREPKPVARGTRDAVLAATRQAEPGMLVIHNHPTGVLEPSAADLAIAAELHGGGIGLAITDNDCSELYVVVEPAEPREQTDLDGDAIDAALGPGGPISRAHPAYEDRPTQREMAQAVAGAYNRGGIFLAEAGTGTGKSIAYLLPAVRWAALNRERTVVSTNTINLQEQLVGKDLPFLRRSLAESFRYVLVKGRGNYISIRRANLAFQTQATLFGERQGAELAAIREWLHTTRDGSLQDLPFTPAPEVWDEVASEADVCLRAKCPTFEQCFYQRARRDAASADVLVVNHHLLFSDLAVRRAQGNYTAPAVLPPYTRVILDEAHNLEDAATSHLGAGVSRRGLLRLLARLERRGRGILRTVEERLRARKDDLLQQDALNQIGGSIRPAVDRARSLAADLFAQLELVLLGTEDGVLRVDDAVRCTDAWTQGVLPRQEDLLVVLEALARALDRLRETIQLDERWRAGLEEQLIEIHGVAGRVRSAVEAIRLVFAAAETEPVPLVRWLERRGGGGGSEANVLARAAPVDLSEALRDSLFDRVTTAVLTSATLTTRDGFGFLRGRLGLSGGGLLLSEQVFPSPFEYETQTVVAVPTDLPLPGGDGGAAYDMATANVAEDLAGLSDGGLFVLFTSYRSLRGVAAELRRRGVEGRWPLFVQGEAPRAALLQRFAASGRGILLGVASFWEGVDVPGDPLRGLVITKLPFMVPTEPLTAARIEAIERDGGNSFYEYMLPHAALRLKQGFGRLIRSRADRGAVVLLDRRVIEKGYGRYFLGSLPPAPVLRAPWSELRATLAPFYGERAVPVIA
jgi:ATP-dependent DNA helicase DinG